MTVERRKGRRGFASMDPARVREIAVLGGRAAHAKGSGVHEWTAAEAGAAGRKGGRASVAARAARKAASEPE